MVQGYERILCGCVDIGADEFGIGDYDCNRTVDLTDYWSWVICMTGPQGEEYIPGCEAFDFDADDNIDLLDFAGFARTFPGP